MLLRGPAAGRGAQVAVTGEPSTSVVAPLLREAAAVLLVVERGAPTREVRAAKRLSEQWSRPPDAVVVTA
ncbi:hypothetical protein GTR00_16695 [Kineococcus sp. T90]|nr:hypothetical protein [Kineococcus indalonis]